MGCIFISFSSVDRAAAAEVRDRLIAQGYPSAFLDFHPEDGIPAGRDWERELYHQLGVCSAVVALCSEASMRSQWCFAEVTQARSLGKPVFALRLDRAPLHAMLA